MKHVPLSWLGRLLSPSLLLRMLPLVLLAFVAGSPAVPVAASPQASQAPSESWLITWDASTKGSGVDGSRSVTRQSHLTASIVVNYYADGSSDYYANEYTATYLVDYLDDHDCDFGGHYRNHLRWEVTDPTRYSGIGPVTPNTVMPYKPTPWTGTKWTINSLSLFLGNIGGYYKRDTKYCGSDEEHEYLADDSSFLENLTSYVRSPFNSDDNGVFLYDVDTQFPVDEFGVTYPLFLKEHLRVERLSGRDLTVHEIEVTQGLQLHNTIPLVQGRRTIVRAYIDIGTEPGPLADVTGRLRVYSGATQLGELEPFNMAGSISAKRTPDWHQIDDTLNFELPWLWTQSPSLRFEVEVNPTHAISEINYDNNTRSVELSLRNCDLLKIGYLPIRFAPPGVTPTSPTADIARAHEFMRQVYPVADDELLYYPIPGITWKAPVDGAAFEDQFQNSMSLILFLDDIFLLTYRPDIDRLVGWLPGNASQQTEGLSDEIVAWVTQKKDPNIWRATLAHELGHTYGLDHTTETTDGYHWFDVYERSIKPEMSYLGLADFMYIPPMLPEKDDWVSPDSYNALYSQFCSGGSTTSRPASPQTATDVLVMSGSVSLTDTQSGQLEPLFRVIGKSLTPPAGTSYYVVLKNGATELGKYGFDPELDVEATQVYTPTRAPFTLAVPYPAGLTQVDLTDQYGNTLTSRTASAHPPTVTVQFPNAPGLTLDGVQTIQWAGSDADGDTLTYSVLYSQDNGATWSAIGAALTGNSYPVDFGTIPGSLSALIKVLVSDGFHTASDVSDHPFSVPGKPPVPVIVSPPSGAHFKAGETIKLQGYAVDLEEGMVAPGSLSWSSNLDGALGAGSLREVTLSAGTHTLTLVASGGAASATTTVVVETPSSPQHYQLYLPLVRR